MKNNIFLKFVLTIFLLAQCNLYAQTASYGNAYVPSKSAFPVYGELLFDNSEKGELPGILNTNKGSEPGTIVFFKEAIWNNANDLQHVNGFVKSYAKNGFTYPIGDLGFYRPLIIKGDTKGTTAAYFLDNPIRNINVASISKREISENPESIVISDTEYWLIKGDEAVNITLTYDLNSSIGQLTNEDLSQLKIVGWNGNNWEIIPSTIDVYQSDLTSCNINYSNKKSSIKNGAISTLFPVIPNDYTIFTFGVENSDNTLIIEPEFNTTIENNEIIEFTLFPNPALDFNQLNIDYKLTNIDKQTELVIYNEYGQLVYNQELKEAKSIFKLPISESTGGIYYFGIITKSGSSLYKPLVITSN